MPVTLGDYKQLFIAAQQTAAGELAEDRASMVVGVLEV
jgi:hypothetical protein